MSIHYWYVFPIAVVVCTLATSSGFSGSVLFQPVFYFILRIPLSQSIATGIATETIGMTNGALTYWYLNSRSGSIDKNAVTSVLPFVFTGVVVGILFFVYAPKPILRLAVGIVMTSIAVYQVWLAGENRIGTLDHANLKILSRPWWRAYQVTAGAFSASTGTGVAEMHQPLFEAQAGLRTTKSNASAICIEAIADWLITLTNINLGNIRYDILIFSVSGVLVGGQIGPRIACILPARCVKTVFGICVAIIGALYVITSCQSLIH